MQLRFRHPRFGAYTLRFKPAIDGWIVTDAPDTLFRLGRENPVPLIIGTNSDEGTTLQRMQK